MIRVGILNATGYIGMELLRILSRHPEVEIVCATSRSIAGRRVKEALPHLDLELKITGEVEVEVDVLFSALPHKASAHALLPFLKREIRIIDLSADFRLKDVHEYKRWYGEEHPAPQFLKEAVYGLPEINGGEIARSKLIANPGCYATAVILSLAPLVKGGLIEPEIIIDAKSGISGAGRTLTQQTHFPEADENLTAYALEGHRHLPEISQELKRISDDFSPEISFLPHLVPMSRGIFISCYLKPKKHLSTDKLREIFVEFYRGRRFVRVVDSPPQTKWVRGGNFCFICPFVDIVGRVVVLSVLDNLVKGGAGQAVQNMNIMLGFPEDMGLSEPSLFP